MTPHKNMAGKTERKKNRSRQIIRTLFFACVLMLFPASCTGPSQTPASQGQAPVQETGVVLYGTYDYDSLDTAVLADIDTEEGTVTFISTAVPGRYTLGYDGTTVFYDRYGRMISLSQIREGDVMDLKFIKGRRHLTAASLSQEAWTKESSSQYYFDSIKGEVTIGSDIYKLSDSLFCISGNEELMYEEINSVDVLTFRGIGTEVVSIGVEKGHGYLRLSGHEYFVGGWIEIGTKYIRKITEDMLLTVPEGTYNVVVSADGTTVDRSVTIGKGLETVLDLSDVVPEAPKEGMVLFSLTPSDAVLFVDGEKVDISAAVTLPYGLHQLMCTCDGYVTVTKYLSVGEESAGISIVLEKESEDKEDKDEKDAGGDNATPAAGDVTTDSGRVFINAPALAECYVDGNYVGVVPCSFKKSEGSHVVTLSLAGYNTRSYTITVDSTTADMTFSFTDLEPINRVT